MMKIIVTKALLDHNFDEEKWLRTRRLKVVGKRKGVWRLGPIHIYGPPDFKEIKKKECEVWECESVE